MSHLQVVTGLSDQLYRNEWGVLGEFWGGGGRYLIIAVGTVPWSGLFFSDGLPLVVFVVPLLSPSWYYSYALDTH